jgi:hypothetical protein
MPPNVTVRATLITSRSTILLVSPRRVLPVLLLVGVGGL